MAAIIVFIIGLFALISGVLLGRKNLRVASWPTARATILEKGLGMSDRAIATGPAARTAIKVTYAFEVGGRQFKGNGLYPTYRLYTPKAAERILGNLPKAIVIYYNPSNPSEAYIYKDSWVVPILTIVFGLLTVLGSTIYFLKNLI